MNDLTNEERLATVLRESGKPWLLDVAEAMELAGMTPDQILQHLFMVANVRRFTKWGQVATVIQNGAVRIIKQEQTTKFD